METYLYRLSFRGPVHFGKEGIGLEAVEDHFPSDGLTSALINAASILFGPNEASRMVEALNAEPPAFVLSSLFPYGPDPADEKKIIEALIKPLSGPPARYDFGPLLKKWKRLKYIHPKDFIILLENKEIDASVFESMVERSEKLTKEWWREDVRPRVAIDREGRGSALWNQAGIFFSTGEKDESGRIKRACAGLYGLVRFRDEKWKNFLEGAFRFLSEAGVGGERTYGLGLFQFMGFEPPNDIWKRILHANQGRHILLSVFYPRDDEREMLRDSFEAWEIKERRGYIVTGKMATTIKRKSIRILIEGSVSQKPFTGSVVEVSPENIEAFGIPHRIIRSGLAFFVPFGGNT